MFTAEMDSGSLALGTAGWLLHEQFRNNILFHQFEDIKFELKQYSTVVISKHLLKKSWAEVCLTHFYDKR